MNLESEYQRLADEYRDATEDCSGFGTKPCQRERDFMALATAQREEIARLNTVVSQMSDARAEVMALRAKLAIAEDGWHQANGVAELAMKHRDEAEVPAINVHGIRDCAYILSGWANIRQPVPASEAEDLALRLVEYTPFAAPQPPVAPVSGWQPIETAPKEMGSYLTFPDHKILWYMAEFKGGKDGRKPFCWYDDDDYPHVPTHWMPLPPAPEKKS